MSPSQAQSDPCPIARDCGHSSAPRGGAPERYHVILPVWGEKYVDRFLSIALPTLLAPGNLPALAGRCTVQVFTTPSDLHRLRSAGAFRRLEQLVDVVIETVSERQVAAATANRNHYQLMTECHNRGIQSGRGFDMAFVFCPPDLVWAEGSFAAADRRLRAGSRAVLVLPVRVRADDTALAALRRAADGGDATELSIPRRELVAAGLKHLHPLSIAQVCHDDDPISITGHHFWPVRYHGLLARAFHVHPFVVWPRVQGIGILTTMDHEFVRASCPDLRDIHLVKDTDEIAVCELSDTANHTLDWFTYIPPGEAKFVEWLNLWTSDYHRASVRERIFIHAREIDDEWNEAIRSSDATIDRLLGAFEAFHAARPDRGAGVVGSKLAMSIAVLSQPPRWSAAIGLPLLRRVAGAVESAWRTVRPAVRAAYRAFHRKLYLRLDGHDKAHREHKAYAMIMEWNQYMFRCDLEDAGLLPRHAAGGGDRTAPEIPDILALKARAS